MERWKPHVTVAAVLEREGRFLLVEETTETGIRFNQPAGHLEPGESLLDAVVRETFEESSWHIVPDYLLGVYQWYQPDNQRTWLRFAFTGKLLTEVPDHALDTGIVAAHWLTLDEVVALSAQHRSPLVMACIRDYLAGVRLPLEVLHDID
jgi:8-oxo-dGTP pyrophosphatase MutT (NUDIX family)